MQLENGKLIRNSEFKDLIIIQVLLQIRYNLILKLKLNLVWVFTIASNKKQCYLHFGTK